MWFDVVDAFDVYVYVVLVVVVVVVDVVDASDVYVVVVVVDVVVVDVVDIVDDADTLSLFLVFDIAIFLSQFSNVGTIELYFPSRKNSKTCNATISSHLRGCFCLYIRNTDL